MMTKNSKRYQDLAQNYDRWYDEYPALAHAEIELIRSVLPTGYGLEIGAGSGRFMQSLGIARGIEPAANMRMLAKEKGVLLDDGYAESLPYANATFDFVCFFTALEFVDDEQVALREAKRVLRPSGHLIISFLNGDLNEVQELKNDPAVSAYYEFARFQSPNVLITKLQRLGFAAEALQQIVYCDDHYVAQDGAGDGVYTVLVAICP